MYDRIVVPLDGSELAERALPQAEGLSRLTSAPLHLVRVVDLTRLERYGPYAPIVPAGAFDRVLAEEREAAREELEATARNLAARDLAVTVEVRHGTVTHELVRLSRPGDVMVMASHGRGGLVRWFLGSVAEEVVRRSPVPVLLVRTAPPAEPTV